MRRGVLRAAGTEPGEAAAEAASLSPVPKGGVGQELALDREGLLGALSRTVAPRGD